MSETLQYSVMLYIVQVDQYSAKLHYPHNFFTSSPKNARGPCWTIVLYLTKNSASNLA